MGIVFKSKRFWAYFFFWYWIASALGVGYAAYYSRQSLALTALMCLATMGAIALVMFSVLSNDVYLNDDGTLRMELKYPLHAKYWNGKWADIEQIRHERSGAGDGSTVLVLIRIRGIGLVSLDRWDLETAEALGNKLGIAVDDEEVEQGSSLVKRSEVYSLH